jgi:hypothetical protein
MTTIRKAATSSAPAASATATPALPTKSAWKPSAAKAAEAAMPKVPEPITAASFPALPTKAPVRTATAAPVTASRSFADIAREAHARSEAAAAEELRREVHRQQQEAREAREVGVFRHIASGRGGYRGSDYTARPENVVDAVTDAVADAVGGCGRGGGGYNSAQYISQYGGDAAERHEEHDDYEGYEGYEGQGQEEPYDDEEVSGFY